MIMITDEKLAGDLYLRQQKLQKAVTDSDAAGILLSTDVNIYYMTGFVFNGYYYLPAHGDSPVLFVKRPVGLSGERIFPIRKPEDIHDIFISCGWMFPENLLMETDVMPYSECVRMQKILHVAKTGNATAAMRNIRRIKTLWETEQLRLSAKRHAAVYSTISKCYRPGMTDLMLQAEIERQMRLHGSIGIFRTFGSNMNIFMGSILAGENAGTPSPFDFALGGGGQTGSCPVGANGTALKDGMTVMVDMVGNYTDYLTDMTRVFSIGTLPEPAYRAHQTSIEIQQAFEESAKPGASCAELYGMAHSIVKKAGLADCFMGTRQQARFIGHGIGLEINEPPVFTPKSKEFLEQGTVFALEPKFVIPHTGAVGIENSFIVTDAGIEKITLFEENIIPL